VRAVVGAHLLPDSRIVRVAPRNVDPDPCGSLDPEFGILACDPDLGSAIPILDL